MGKYKYLDSERKTNKVLKMQEQQLESLLESTEQNSPSASRVAEITGNTKNIRGKT